MILGISEPSPAMRIDAKRTEFAVRPLAASGRPARPVNEARPRPRVRATRMFGARNEPNDK